ncbi:hypothetical protein Pfo_020365 [Paulownia fortunei]|nr:hypothetical protein Pfo_020365 [Paulownia fortunei]
MAAYAALVSLTHILDQIQHPPPTHQIIVVNEQIESLREKVSFLIDFLENYSSRRSKDIEDLETRIADAAYTAEDIIESNVMNQIRAKSAVSRKKSSTLLRRGIQTVIENFLSIEKELEKIKDKKRMEDLQPKNSTIASSSRPLPSGKNTMVGFHDHLIQIMNALTTDESNRRIIPIVGMGGIGKTTLSTNVYNNPFIVQHFHIRIWVTVSQEYNVRELLIGLLHQLNCTDPTEQERSENLATFSNKMSQKSDDQLGLLLHKELFERKYLIVMDDMWNIQAWDEVKMFLPDNYNGSRVLVTTRLLNLAVHFGSCSPYEMEFLDEEQSWDLFRENVFEQEGCPVELEEIGKNIAKRCRGLPLALVVIGGLLAKSKWTKEHWESVERDVTSIVNNENDEHFMKILSLSYSHLPIYLKPCFLYLAMFPEDFEIHVSRLVKLWVAEGLIKRTRAKNLEEVAEEYLKDLIDRNLTLPHKRGSSGKVKSCRIHDLLRDLCWREAHKDKFLCIANLDDLNISPYINRERRLSIRYSRKKEKVRKALRSAALSRSLLSNFEWKSGWIARSCSLLRVLDVVDRYSAQEILRIINSRYVACTMYWDLNSTLSSISLLWNLQTLIVDGNFTLPPEIWQMPQLRHLKIRVVRLCDPPHAQIDGQNIIVLENLQTLSTVENFRCIEQVFKRIPNLKKLGITYDILSEEFGPYCLSNLVHLHKLESLRIRGDQKLWGNIAFPSSLKKLILSDCVIAWEDMSMVGLLPNLEVLKLWSDAAKGKEWNPIEGEFCRLKFLLIDVRELEIWGADNTHFPSLERLLLRRVSLKEIPIGFAEIPTLQLINLSWSSRSLSTSANEISEERESLGYEGLQVLLPSFQFDPAL